MHTDWLKYNLSSLLPSVLLFKKKGTNSVFGREKERKEEEGRRRKERKEEEGRRRKKGRGKGRKRREKKEEKRREKKEEGRMKEEVKRKKEIGHDFVSFCF